MKRAALILFVFTCFVWVPNAFSQTSVAETRRRIAALEEEQNAIRQESFQIAGGQTVAESVRKTSANKFALENQIRVLEPAIEQIEGTRAELVRMREEVQSKAVITGRDVGENITQDAAEDIALAGASQAAHRVVGWVGFIADAAEVGNRYEIKYSNLADLKQSIDRHHANLRELYDVAVVLYHAQSVERNKLKRLQEMQDRDREVWRELAELKDSLKTPKPLPPRTNPGRDTDAAGDETLRATARREAMRVGPADPNAILPSQLVGFWTATGYTCNGPEIDEFVEISYSPEEGLVATKAMGDNCVHSTEVTWRGKLEGRTIRGQVHLRAMNAPLDSGSWMDTTLEVISINEIRGFDVVFHR